jgi:hypothetical protein
MYKSSCLLILLLINIVSYAQPSAQVLNSYFLKYKLYPISTADFILVPNYKGEIENIETTVDDTIHYNVFMSKNNVSSVIYDTTRLNLSYCFGKISKMGFYSNENKINQTKFVKIFPFMLIFNGGLQYTVYKGFGNINKIRSLSGLKTICKTKITYRDHSVTGTKDYCWQTVAQKCYYCGYSNFKYINDTTVIENIYDRNDSLAIRRTHTFDKSGNILKIQSLIKKEVTGYGIDITFYSYTGNTTETRSFVYKFDYQGNWVERLEYLDDKYQSKTVRIINYRIKKATHQY